MYWVSYDLCVCTRIWTLAFLEYRTEDASPRQERGFSVLLFCLSGLLCTRSTAQQNYLRPLCRVRWEWLSVDMLGWSLGDGEALCVALAGMCGKLLTDHPLALAQTPRIE